jgi:hypothetical protein
VKNIQIIGRRGVVQSAFTIKEIREISRIDKVQIYMFRNEFERSMTEASIEELGSGFSPFSRGWNRRTEFLKDACEFIENEE